MSAHVDSPEAVFAGFWMGGYEGADHVNGVGTPLDMAHASGHLDRLEEDHRRAAQAGLTCIRESVGWRLCEAPGGAIDLARVLRIQASARRHGLQVLWTLMHYGLPADLDLHDDALVPRFARFCAEVARALGDGGTRPPIYNPVNEIGFLAWAATQRGILFPPNGVSSTGGGPDAESSRVSGYDIKRRLARASLAGMRAIRERQPRARFLHVEPVVHVVAPLSRPDLAPLAEQVASWQWQAWDLLAGRIEPELGGGAEWIDIVGVNHYHSSQWEVDTEARLSWSGRDPRRRPMRTLLAQAWERYRKPVIVAETSHVGAGRGAWLDEVASEVRQARAAGVPVQGLCLYPLVDRPDWNPPGALHRSGLWHVAAGTLETGPPTPRTRRVEREMLASLRAWQRVFPGPEDRSCAATAGAEASPGVVGRGPAAARAGGSTEDRVLLAFSHLRWEFMRHRSRHLLGGLAEPGNGWRVVFVEEPLRAERPRLDVLAAGPCVDVLVPYLPDVGDGFAGVNVAPLRALLAGWLAAQGIERPLVWLSTPMAWPLTRAMPHGRVVYDCADELAGFLNAPAPLPALEDALLRRADRVFTAGSALAAPRSLAAGAARLQTLPNGVDLKAFARRVPATAPADWEAEEAAGLQRRASPGPCLGYAGVVDERFDLRLLAHLADARPHWHFVIAGPVLKIADRSVPRRSNLHWLGPQPYRVLPALMHGWQAALLPWRDTLATRHARPLKVLEALAAGLPVVATALPEVMAWSAAGVTPVAAGNAPAFLQACDAALAETADARKRRRHAAARALRRLDWRRLRCRLSATLETLEAMETLDSPGARGQGRGLGLEPQGQPVSACVGAEAEEPPQVFAAAVRLQEASSLTSA